MTHQSEVHPDVHVILIGGSSHAGKSTVARALAARLGWLQVATDSLARHPGRPWVHGDRRVPGHVAEHYLSLSVDELIEDVLHHYRVNVWPLVEAIVRSHTTDPDAERLVLEGSALWPESVAGLEFDNVAAVWLTATDHVFERRIYTAARYRTCSTRERRMVDSFLQRTLRYDERMMEAVRRLGLPSIDVEGAPAGQLVEQCLALMRAPHR